jgi:CHAT domain-containing protein/Tfp pilus assembly protein PilF
LTLAIVFLPGDRLPVDAEALYNSAWQLFVHGDLARSQHQAELGYHHFRNLNADWASRFQVLAAEAMVWRGTNDDALALLNSFQPPPASIQTELKGLAFKAVALSGQQRIAEADDTLKLAESLCAQKPLAPCGEVYGARGIFYSSQGKIAPAAHSFQEALTFARAHQDRFLEANQQSNLGWIALQSEHFDEAIDWLRSANRNCTALGAEEVCERVNGNLGWAYFGLGDGERALDLFLEAQKSAARRGSLHSELGWISTAGYVYMNSGDLKRASQSYSQTLQIARQINSKADIINSLEDLAYMSIEAGDPNQAEAYINQLDPLIRAGNNRLDDLDIMLARGKIASARRQDQQAETIFRAVEHDPASQTSMKLDAEHQLALLYERRNDQPAADRMYRTALASFESARDQLKNEDSKIPFVSNATDIYDDYIHFLVSQGKAGEALRIADQSRAQTLAQGLALVSNHHSTDSSLNPTQIARSTHSTLLFYWLGDKQSWLWAANSKKIALFTLPPQREISTLIEHYRKTLLGIGDPAKDSDPDGIALYRTLIAPAAELLPHDSNVVILCDGALSLLNFEALIVPGPRPHYWIDDAAVVSASSLRLLASAASPGPSGNRLLLIGDPVSPNVDYPELPEAASEMKQIQQTAAMQSESVFARDRATAAAYLDSNPQRFAYIHFVAHGVASRTDPLDSAIILSRSTAADDSFKLHAREILQHPIRARLVTISACYGSGTRSYAGEGLVGLSWAFLHAGAHNVIGALWDVSDESTPQLMTALYKNLAQGMPPASALRQAKLSLIHSQSQFHDPFYWAPFQLYTGL